VNGKFRFAIRAVVPAICIIAVLWVATCAYLYSVMRRPPEEFARFMAKIPGPVAFLIFPFETLWLRARSGALHVGDSAPDFSLTKLDKTEHVQLSSLTARRKPVVLIFGSYT
jgi:hypothetical protein